MWDPTWVQGGWEGVEAKSEKGDTSGKYMVAIWGGVCVCVCL